MSVVSAEEKLACVKRELGWRKRVYPNRVETGRMSLAQMVHEIRCMEAIIADYEQAAKTERLPL